MDFVYRMFIIIRALINNSIFMISLALLTFGFAVAMKMLAISWMTPKLFWFIIGLGLGFLLVPISKTLVHVVPSANTSESDV